MLVNLCDSNVWLALALSGHVRHQVACNWLETVEEPASVLFCRATEQAFLRLLANASVLAPYGNPPLTNSEAWAAYEALVADERIVFRAREPRVSNPGGRSLPCGIAPHRSSGWMPTWPPSPSPEDSAWSRPTPPSGSSRGWTYCCSVEPRTHPRPASPRR